MARTQSRPAAAGASPSSFLPAHPELLPDVLPDAERTRLALAAVLELLHGCDPDYQLSAGGLLLLLEPIAGGLDALCGDLRTATGAFLIN